MDATQPGPLTNSTLELIARRRSTRAYDPAPLTADEKQAIVHSALRAPTAGGMVLYTILEVEDQALKDRLAVTCDDQPFIARAPWVLVFVADMQKWTDLFEACDVRTLEGVEHRSAPGPGDLLLACSDALIAAQSAVIAAESLGIGSCYIGDILENGEEVAELLGLPPHTLPAAMVCFGRSVKAQEPIPHYGRHLVHTDRYQRLPAEGLAGVADDLATLHAPHGLPSGVQNYPQAVYRRKYTSAFMREMNRSVAWWMDRWQES
ncbi:MAG: nitroreductase family protein [Coriobacteriia bacterium]|nr:nitroreductase family protein [Coriobacteriia bacterium]